MKPGTRHAHFMVYSDPPLRCLGTSAPFALNIQRLTTAIDTTARTWEMKPDLSNIVRFR